MSLTNNPYYILSTLTEKDDLKLEKEEKYTCSAILPRKMDGCSRHRDHQCINHSQNRNHMFDLNKIDVILF